MSCFGTKVSNVSFGNLRVRFSNAFAFASLAFASFASSMRSISCRAFFLYFFSGFWSVLIFVSLLLERIDIGSTALFFAVFLRSLCLL